MFGSTVLDAAIGLVFVFLLASLIASAVREGLEAWLKTRASHLEAGLREILRDREGIGLVKQFYNHPLINSLFLGDYAPNQKLQTGWMLFTRGRNLPSYIPSSNFAIALMDMAARGPQVTDSSAVTASVTLESIRANVGSIENPAVQRALLIAIDRADGDLAKAHANLEAWYNSAMDRVSGWYKRSTQSILLALGLVMAVALNINTVRIGATLYHDQSARSMVVESAKKASTGVMNYDAAMTDLGDLSLLIGWPNTFQGVQYEIAHYWVSDLAGWILTAFAISLGAPFWFDLLNRLIVIRSTVKPHQKSPEEPSTDSQSSSPAAPLPTPKVIPAPAPLGAPNPDPDRVADGCDVDMTKDVTADGMLPSATGGVR